MKGLVLDSSALFYGKDLPSDFELVITPGVATELRRHDMEDRLDLLLETRVRVLSPSKHSLVRVISEGERTGDSRRLSSTDKEVLALALDLGYEIVTDDYSVQNLASALGIAFRGLEQKEIRSVVTWKAKCRGCGKVFDADVQECDVCGSPTSMKGGKR
ncbi:MAG: nucleic acid-binding protein [Methanobacteriota archaeon]|nr:MAG: nucleic acid-binding protein [Euryarchaeota archaeon]